MRRKMFFLTAMLFGVFIVSITSCDHMGGVSIGIGGGSYGHSGGVSAGGTISSDKVSAGSKHAHAAEAAGDERTPLEFAAEEKTAQRAAMRRHMEALSDIAGAFASNDLKKAAVEAKQRLGSNPEEEAECRKLADESGEKEFLTFALAMHKKADEVSALAGKGDKAGAERAFSELIARCNACHERYRF